MKQILTYLLFIWILLPLKAEEKIYTVDNIPKVHLQNKMQYVCNPAGILSQQACDEIDAMLYALEQQTGIETVVAIVPSIGDKDCFEFSHQLLNQWGVGKKGKDNGLVILLVTDQRCIQFYTGYGLEGILPDAICKRIQMQEMIPYLKKGEWNQGMLAGVKAVCQRLDGSMVNDDEGRGEEGISVSMLLVVILGFITIAGVVGILAVRASTRCPKCGKHQLQRSSTKLISNRNGVKTEDIIYTCRNCGHTVVRRQQSYDDNYRGRGGGGPFIGGFGGGSFGSGGGGGFSGGSFGAVPVAVEVPAHVSKKSIHKICESGIKVFAPSDLHESLISNTKRNNMKKSVIILIAVVAVIIIWAISAYNGLVSMDENVSSQWANVETQYQRRADLIPNLVNTVKGYASHEKETLEGVVEARSKATQIKVDANDLTPEKLAEYQKAQGAVTSALGKLLAITENYPDLKANQNFLELQAQLEGTENRINVARKNFNDAAQAYNTSIRRFPKSIFASVFGFEKRTYFEAAEGTEKAPEVKF